MDLPSFIYTILYTFGFPFVIFMILFLNRKNRTKTLTSLDLFTTITSLICGWKLFLFAGGSL